MSNAIIDVQFGDRELTASGFTQLKPPEEGRSIIVSFLGKMKASAYHWLPKKMKGYRCNGDGCPACAAGITQSWSAVASPLLTLATAAFKSVTYRSLALPTKM
jgi:hypothetical protein